MDAGELAKLQQELYPIYVRFMDRSRRELARLIPTRECKEHFLKSASKLSESDFSQRLGKLAQRPGRLAELSELIHRSLKGPTAKDFAKWDSLLTRAGIYADSTGGG